MYEDSISGIRIGFRAIGSNILTWEVKRKLLVWRNFFFLKSYHFEKNIFWIFKGRRLGLKGLSNTELSYSHAPVVKSWFHPIEFSKLNFKKPRLHCPAFFFFRGKKQNIAGYCRSVFLKLIFENSIGWNHDFSSGAWLY